MGSMRLSAVTTGDFDNLYRDLRVGVRHAAAGLGRPRSRPDVIYPQIAEKQEAGWTYARIATWLNQRYPAECAGPL